MKKVIVSQIGSRRRYMIPRILASKSMLECLYTDSYCNSLIGKIFKLLEKVGLSNIETRRLLKRNPMISDQLIYANDFLQLKLFFCRLSKCSSLKFKKLRFEGSSLWFKHKGIRNAQVLYNMFIENFEFAEYAKSKGLKLLCDIYENPYVFKELAEDVQSIPEYSCIKNQSQGFLESYDLRMKYFDKMLELSDAYLIPSAYVAESIKRSPCYDQKKANIMPYASSINNTKNINTPQVGRLIWIGSDPVRKGLVYCQRAAKILREKFPYIDFRIIGSIDSTIVFSPEFSALNFIGRLNKEQLIEEYKRADMFVFPTIAEGFSGALLEAASCGVPIITTHASGFGQNFPGIFIEPRNTIDIVQAVTDLLENRDKRNSVSQKLFEYSQNIDSNAFSQNLIELVNSL